MNAFKAVLAFLFGGAIVGAVAGTVSGRLAIPWYYTPGRGMIVQAQFPETAVDIIAQLIRFQLIGAAIGAVLFLIIGALLVRSRGKRAPEAKAAPPGT